MSAILTDPLELFIQDIDVLVPENLFWRHQLLEEAAFTLARFKHRMLTNHIRDVHYSNLVNYKGLNVLLDREGEQGICTSCGMSLFMIRWSPKPGILYRAHGHVDTRKINYND